MTNIDNILVNYLTSEWPAGDAPHSQLLLEFAKQEQSIQEIYRPVLQFYQIIGDVDSDEEVRGQDELREVRITACRMLFYRVRLQSSEPIWSSRILEDLSLMPLKMPRGEPENLSDALHQFLAIHSVKLTSEVCNLVGEILRIQASQLRMLGRSRRLDARLLDPKWQSPSQLFTAFWIADQAQSLTADLFGAVLRRCELDVEWRKHVLDAAVETFAEEIVVGQVHAAEEESGKRGRYLF